MSNICKNCNAVLDDGAKFCTSCGTPVEQTVVEPVIEQYEQQNAQQEFNSEQNFDNNFFYDAEQMDVRQNKAKAVLSYFGLLVLVPIFAAKNSKFARFHANQGLVLMIISVAINIINRILATALATSPALLAILSFIILIISLAMFVISIMGIVNAAKGEMKKLPIIGNIKILK